MGVAVGGMDEGGEGAVVVGEKEDEVLEEEEGMAVEGEGAGGEEGEEDEGLENLAVEVDEGKELLHHSRLYMSFMQ